MDNRSIARTLTSHAHELETEHSSLYRIRAYRQAAETILGLDEPVEAIVARSGRKGLRELPGIGAHLSLTIETLVRTGRLHTFNSVAEVHPLPGVPSKNLVACERPKNGE